MKRDVLKNLSILVILLMLQSGALAQTLKPKITIEEDPRTHNMGIVSDGQYYYTNNGGKAYMGQISKFTHDGKLVTTYDIELDMRALMYNPADKKLYVCTYERIIYRITDLEKGTFEPVLENLYQDEQATLALSPSGKLLYYFSNGTLTVYKFPSGKLVKTYDGLDSGKDFLQGSSAVATDGKYVFTWNSEYKIIFVYTLKGKKVRSMQISKGDYGPSLSYANGMIFISTDGNYDIGYWYGYEPEEK